MKKLNKFFAILVSLAMMAMLAVPAFAATVVSSTSETGANVVMTKALQYATGANNPNKYYKVTLTQVVSGADLETGVETTAITDTNSAFGVRYLNATNEEADATTGITTAYGVQNLFTDPSDVTTLFNSTAGRYQFKVVEDQTNVYSNNTGTVYSKTSDETFNNSKAEYTVFVDVAWNAAGTKLYVNNIAVRQDKNDAGDTGSGKVDLDETKDVDDDSTGNGFKFTNAYVKTKNTTPDGKNDPTDDTDNDGNYDAKGLFVQKTVAGYTADGNTEALTDADKAAKFTFNVTITPAPALTNTTQRTSYKAKVVDTLSTTDTAAAVNTEVSGTNVTIDSTTYEITIPANTAAKITLKHGQRLVLEDIEVGAKYSVSEDSDNAYTTTSAGTGTAAATGVLVDNAVSNVLVTEADAGVAYTNTRKTSNKPTGILISNLPYIALALVAIGGMVAYVVVRRKSSDEA